jgi:hypothetical protein
MHPFSLMRDTTLVKERKRQKMNLPEAMHKLIN